MANDELYPAKGRKPNHDASIRMNLEGLENCFLLKCRGEMSFSALSAMFDIMRPHVEGDEFNLIFDRVGAVTFGHLNDYLALYRHFYNSGIRVFRNLVIDDDPSRARFLQFATEVAHCAGLHADLRHAFPDRDPVPAMRQLLDGFRRPDAPARPDEAEARRILRSQGRHLDNSGLSIDVEREPGGLPDTFLLTFIGKVEFTEIARAFDLLRPLLQGDAFHAIVDFRGATNAVGLEEIRHVYLRYLEAGIVRYRAVAVNISPGHEEVLVQAANLARSIGLDARLRPADGMAAALAAMKEMLPAADEGAR